MSAQIERPGAEEWVPERPSLQGLRAAVQECRGCELHQEATQAVMGAGRARAELLVLGEQPGDQEDRAGKPFVGPAGKLLDRALAEAGIEPDSVYRTNVVKHFRFERRGKQRIHKGPSRVHVAACGPWLVAELDRGAAGRRGDPRRHRGQGDLRFRLQGRRGTRRPAPWPDEVPGEGPGDHHRPEWVLPTTHPSAVLRSRNRDEDYQLLVDDLRVAANVLG